MDVSLYLTTFTIFGSLSFSSESSAFIVLPVLIISSKKKKKVIYLPSLKEKVYYQWINLKHKEQQHINISAYFNLHIIKCFMCSKH